MIYITGDTHGQRDFAKIRTFAYECQIAGKNDYLIITGDFGAIWSEETLDTDLKPYECLPFTILFVDGNHENFDRLYGNEFDIVDFCGGKAHKIRDNVYHLMRGYIFELNGKKFFAFGGASSHDIKDGILNLEDYIDEKELIKTYNKLTRAGKMLRINHLSWWKEEMPSDEEMEFGKQTLAQNDNKVDFIISHCCPQSIALSLSNHYKSDKLTKYFNEINDSISFSKWFFGHYHNDEQIFDKYILLYHQIIRIV